MLYKNIIGYVIKALNINISVMYLFSILCFASEK